MGYQSEFPDFVLDVMIPEGFSDHSWHNDVCPRFEKNLPDGRYLTIWIDFADKKDREYSNCERFAVDLNNSDSTYLKTLIRSDDWQEIVDFVKGYRHD